MPARPRRVRSPGPQEPDTVCHKCGKGTVSAVTERVEGRWGQCAPVRFTDTFYRCPACGEEWFTGAMASRHFRALVKATAAAQQERITELEALLTHHNIPLP